MVDIEVTRRNRILIRVIPLIPLLMFFILFSKDVGVTLLFILGHFSGQPVPPLSEETQRSLLIVAFNVLLGFPTFFVFWSFLFSSQAVLPVNSAGNIFQTALHLLFYILGFHGPMVIIRGGKLQVDAQEIRRPLAGVAIVDLNSAMILERVIRPGFIPTFRRWIRRVVRGIYRLLRIPLPAEDPVRVCGPGLTFIDYDERIQGVGDLKITHGLVETLPGAVDLRRQFRSSGSPATARPDTKQASVHAYTRDGIELGTNVAALFTIGQDMNAAPNVLHVTYDGDPNPENLRVVTFREQNRRVLIQSFEDELDADDRLEIYNEGFQGPMRPYVELPRASRPPAFDPGRVFSAVYSQAHSESEEVKDLSWLDLPVAVGIDVFREMLSHVNFDELYMPIREDDETLMVGELRRQFRTRMRYAGIVSYRVLTHARNQPLVVNQDYPYRSLLVSPVRRLKTNRLIKKEQVLRERGIQIILAGFGNLLPEKEIYRQWLSSWRADWERAVTTTLANADLEAKRIYNRARIEQQQELALSLRDIFEDNNNTREVIAIRILQALETIAADQKTKSLLPPETISMLKNIHDWVLPEEK